MDMLPIPHRKVHKLPKAHRTANSRHLVTHRNNRAAIHKALPHHLEPLRGTPATHHKSVRPEALSTDNNRHLLVILHSNRPVTRHQQLATRHRQLATLNQQQATRHRQPAIRNKLPLCNLNQRIPLVGL